MDQPHWNTQGSDTGTDFELDSNESNLPTETFYVALKLALARLKEYSAVTTG